MTERLHPTMWLSELNRISCWRTRWVTPLPPPPPLPSPPLHPLPLVKWAFIFYAICCFSQNNVFSHSYRVLFCFVVECILFQNIVFNNFPVAPPPSKCDFNSVNNNNHNNHNHNNHNNYLKCHCFTCQRPVS